MADAQIQTVSVTDVARAVERALNGELQSGQCYDLVEDQPHSMRDLIAAHRRWLGFPKAALTINIPSWLLSPVAGVADVLGKLGWRSPLR